MDTIYTHLYTYMVYIHMVWGEREMERERETSQKLMGKHWFGISSSLHLHKEPSESYASDSFVWGRAVLYMQSFDPHSLSCIRMGPGPGTPRYQAIRILKGCAFSTLCESVFFCFRLNVCSFVLLKWVFCMTLGQPNYYIHPLKGGMGESFIVG